MNQRDLELALRKQRLLIHSQALREQWGAQAQALPPVLHGIDRVSDGVRWARDNAPLLSGVGIFLLVARPRAGLRWARRAWMGWQLVRRVRALIS